MRMTRPDGAAPTDPLKPLLERVGAGDERAMAELYDRTCAQAFGWALRVTRDRAVAEEAVLDAYSQAWTQASRHDASRGSVEGWLLMMVRSRAMDGRRTARRRSVETVLEPDDVSDAAASPEAAANDTARARRVRTAIATLPAEQRQVIDAAFFEGLSHSEMATKLNLPLGTVKTRVRTALASLRGRIDAAHVGEMA